ncbi:MAG TPA: cupin domain-containing protein [Sporichthyaceae bacterium]|nr:cupin domain-containing protein [Sporichthyaceae bacterium]
MGHLPKPPTMKGPAEWFTGEVWIDPIFQGKDPARAQVLAVRFTPAARTAWHCHVLGQTLYVTEGRGLIQSRGAAIAELRPGDIVRAEPEEWHWHGAAADHFMTHLSITEAPYDTSNSEMTWGAHVTDAEYSGH